MKKIELKCVKAMNELGKNVSRMCIEDSFKLVELDGDGPPLGELEQIAADQNQLAHFHLRVTGGLADPYSDGEQTPLSGREAQILRCRWASGGDYNPFENPTLSHWVRDCYNGDLPAVKAQVEKDPKLIEKRESVLRKCALFHVISGGRTIDPALFVPNEMKARLTSKSDHIGCIRYLLEKGARVDARDLAGHTPLFYCTGTNSNSLTLKIAKLLLEHGADINAKNRMGCTPLFEPTMASRFDCVDFLLENGARVDVIDNDGIILASLGAHYPDLAARFSTAYAIQASKEKDKAKLAGTYGACNQCKTTSNVRRCTGCFVVWYCGAECQKQDWASHKSRCKSVKKGYKKIALQTLPVRTNINYLSKTAETRTNMPSNGITPELKTKQHFMVKIQVPLNLVTSRKMPKNSPYKKDVEVAGGALCVYNQERTVYGEINPSCEYYNQLVDLIVEKGSMGGAKGYFCAIYDEKDGLKINVEEIQLPQPW